MTDLPPAAILTAACYLGTHACEGVFGRFYCECPCHEEKPGD